MVSPETEAEIERLLALPYHKLIRGNPIDGYVASVPELPGCMTDGDSEEEALTNLREAMALWLEEAIEEGDPIPAPAERLRLTA